MASRQRLIGTAIGTATLLALVAGCGSTVSGVANQSLPAGGELGGVNSDGTTTGAPLGAAAGSTGSVGTTAATGGSTGAASGSAFATSVTGSTAGGAALSTAGAPGITKTEILVGIPYAVNGAAANNAIGGAGVTQGDEKGEYQALIDDVNRRGGIDGRKLVPVWHEYDALSNDTVDSLFEAMCADFTQDHHVFAIFAGGSPIIQQCAQRAGAVLVYDNLSESSSRTFAKFPSYVEISMLDLDRALLNEAIALQAQGYFSPWNATTGQAAAAGGQSKVGIIGLDTPDYHFAIDRVLQPQLARFRHAAAAPDVIYLQYPQRTSDLSQLSAAEANAIVKFRQDGVEHVLIVDNSGTLTLEFLNQAESQHYHPRYGWNSQNAPELLVGAGDVQPDQMPGSMGIGYWPSIDLAANDNPDDGPYSNAPRRQCLSYLTSKGFSFADSNAKAVALLQCNDVWFLRQTMTAAAKPINQASFIDAVNHLGSSFTSAMTFGTFYSPAQHDGGASYYDYEWNTTCQCMRYTGARHAAIGEGEH